MQIGKIKISNYRGLESLELYPNDKNVIVGDSNIGKSTILKALDLSLNPNIPYYRDLFNENDFYKKKTKNPIKIKITFENLTEEELNYFSDYVEPGKNIDNIKESANDISVLDDDQKYLQVIFICEYMKEEYDYTFATYFFKENNFNEKKRLTKKDKYIIGFQLIDPLKDANQINSLSKNSMFYKLIKQNDINMKKQIGEIIENKLPQVSQTIHDNEEFNELTNILGEYIVDYGFIGEDTDLVKFELGNMTQNDILKKIEMFIESNKTKISLPLSYHGSGLINSIAISTALLLSKNNKRGIIAIEEPEIGLHPHAQEYLSHQLKNLNSQVFVTTHSPDIADCFDLEDFIILNKKDENTKVNQLDFDSPEMEPNIRNAERYNKDEIIKSFFGKMVLLVEGSTEKSALPVIFNKLSQQDKYVHYSKLGINIVNTGSVKNIKDYGKTFQGFNIPVVAVIDNDPEESGGGDNKELIETIRNNTDLLILLPEDPIFYDFEGVMCYRSDFQILKKSLIEIVNIKNNADSIKGILYSETKKINEDFFGSMKKQNFNSLNDCLNFLNQNYQNYITNKELKLIYKRAFEKFKGARYPKIWASNYNCSQIPKEFKEIYKELNTFVLNKKEGDYVEFEF